MIGPGWMPSRPRPLAARRGGLYGSVGAVPSATRRRRRTARKRSAEPGVRSEGAIDVMFRMFDRGRAKLPIAIVQPDLRQPRHRMIGAQIGYWLANRFAWIRPRIVPLAVAFAGLFALIGVERYLSALARGDAYVMMANPNPRAMPSADDVAPKIQPTQR